MKTKKRISIVFDNEIHYESVDIFIQDLNNAIIKKYDIDLHLSTFGGIMNLQQTMSRAINNFPNDVRVFCDGFLLSAGIPLILDLRKDIPVTIGKSLIALAHVPSIALESRNTKKASGFEKFMMDNDDIMCERYLKPIEPVLTAKEIDLVMKGEDVVLDSERFQKLLDIHRGEYHD